MKKICSFALPEDQVAMIESSVKQNGNSKSSIVREALSDFFHKKNVGDINEKSFSRENSEVSRS